MEEQTQEQEQEGRQRVTLEDVAQAVERLGGDPAQLSAGKVRAELGRGSFSTVQKYLDVLRNQKQEVRSTTLPPPPAPDDLLKGLWLAAWAAADAHAAHSISAALQRIDALETQLASARADAEQLAAEVDRLQAALSDAESRADALAEAASAVEAERQSLAEASSAVEAERQSLAAVLEQLRGVLHQNQ
jgi:chromosome segregation ATPase